jgi:glutathione peroxidase
MKHLSFLAALILFVFSSSAQYNFHDYSAATIDHDTISMNQFYGKKVMVVNTATYCAYTYQFTALENLYSNYKQYGFEIVGFPCNDFANQDPHDDSTINQFCTGTYNVTFQMMSKVHTITADTAPVYKFLQRADLNGVANAHVAWNFNKFLIDEAGHWVQHYTQTTEPDDSAIIHWIVDTQGQIIKNIFTGPADNTQTISTDISSLSSGVYLVRVTGNGFQKTLKYVRVK